MLLAGEEYIEASGERYAQSELLGLQGAALMARRSPDPCDATAAYERAVHVAREQNAKLLELPAATRLVAHQRAIGVAGTALERLSTLCDWFAPTSELADVVRARAMLASEPITRCTRRRGHHGELASRALRVQIEAMALVRRPVPPARGAPQTPW